MDYHVIRNAWGTDDGEVYGTPLDELPVKKNKDKFRGCLIGGAAGDAQRTLFTANGLLHGSTCDHARSIIGTYSGYIALSYRN